MNPNGLKAIVDLDEYERRREESLAPFLRMLRAEPDRFRPRCGPAAFPARRKRDRRRALPDCLRAAPKPETLPTRLPWELLPGPKPERVRTRTVYRTLPAGTLVQKVREQMKERRVSMETMAETLHIAPGTFRKWLRSPETMTVRDYGDLAAWLNRHGARAISEGGDMI